MKIQIELILDKNNEAEAAYAEILNMSYAGYNALRMFDQQLPEIQCEVCDCGDTLEYRVNCDNIITSEIIEDIMRKLGGSEL